MNPEELNALDRGQFLGAVGWVFEHSPWVADRAWDSRPFDSLDQLCLRLDAVVETAPHSDQLALLQAHPDLGTRARVSESSAREQADAGLGDLTQMEYENLLQLNTAYKDKFGFPFLYAVKGCGKFDILEALEKRLGATPEEEFATALRQVCRIARFRMEEIIK